MGGWGRGYSGRWVGIRFFSMKWALLSLKGKQAWGEGGGVFFNWKLLNIFWDATYMS